MRAKVEDSLALPDPERLLNLTLAESGSDRFLECVGSADLCKVMFEAVAQSISLQTEHKNADTTKLWDKYHELAECAHNASRVSFKDVWHDYFYGAGLAINPLPVEHAHFYVSDREALLSDWTAVQSDIDRVWATKTEIQKWFGEQVDGRFRRIGPEAIFDEQSEDSDSALGNNSTGA